MSSEIFLIESLPTEMLLEIWQSLDAVTLLKCQAINKTWRRLFQGLDNHFWKEFYLKNYFSFSWRKKGDPHAFAPPKSSTHISWKERLFIDASREIAKNRALLTSSLKVILQVFGGTGTLGYMRYISACLEKGKGMKFVQPIPFLKMTCLIDNEYVSISHEPSDAYHGKLVIYSVRSKETFSYAKTILEQDLLDDGTKKSFDRNMMRLLNHQKPYCDVCGSRVALIAETSSDMLRTVRFCSQLCRNDYQGNQINSATPSVLVAINNDDDPKSISVSREQGEELAKKCGCKFFEVNLNTGENLIEAWVALAREAKNQINKYKQIQKDLLENEPSQIKEKEEGCVIS